MNERINGCNPVKFLGIPLPDLMEHATNIMFLTEHSIISVGNKYL